MIWTVTLYDLWKTICMEKNRHLAVILAVVAIAYVASLLFPGMDPYCWWRSQTGLICPGCGATHSATALFQGDVIGAMQANALFIPVAGLGLYGVYNYWASGDFLPEKLKSRSAAWIVAGIVLAYAIFRNL